MGKTLFCGCCSFSLKCHQQIAPSSFGHSSPENGISRLKAVQGSRGNGLVDMEKEESWGILSRRSIFVSGISLASFAVLGFPGEGLAVVKQGLLAGRIPGLSEPDEQDRLEDIYRRPDDKSGGHGVGWSPIIPYAFSVPEDWEEIVREPLALYIGVESAVVRSVTLDSLTQSISPFFRLFSPFFMDSGNGSPNTFSPAFQRFLAAGSFSESRYKTGGGRL